MACDPNWFGFKSMTEPIVTELMRAFPGCIADTRMLSVVMPGHSIPTHQDWQSAGWRVRVHIPLTTNPESEFIVGDFDYLLLVVYA